MPDNIKKYDLQKLVDESPDPPKFPPFKLYKFGIMVNSLDLSQKGMYIVKQLNDIVDVDCRFSPIVFYKE